MNGAALAANLSRHLAIGTGQLFVLDGLFRDEAIASLFEFVRKLPYNLRDYDSEETSSVRHWLAELPIPLVEGTPVLRDCIQAAHVLAAPAPLRLVRAHANLVTYGDIMFPHQDSDRGVTAIYYANPTWDVAWQGETVFYAADGEPVHTVAPRPGRVAVFDGALFHRSGVPSRACPGPRITVALKFDRA